MHVPRVRVGLISVCKSTKSRVRRAASGSAAPD